MLRISHIEAPPEDGVYIYGMYLDGCKWSYAKNELAESDPKVLFSPVCTMFLRPCRTAEIRSFNSYNW